MGPIGVPEIIVLLVFGGAVAMGLRWLGRTARLGTGQDELRRRVEALEQSAQGGPRPADHPDSTGTVH